MQKRTRIAVVLTAGAVLCGCLAQRPDNAHVVVDPAGAVASIGAALDKVLVLRSSGAVAKDEQVVIDIRCGTYVADKALEITDAHGPLLLKGAGPLGTVVSGGKELGMFRRELDGRTWRNAVSRDVEIGQLFVNDQRAERSKIADGFSEREPGAWYFDRASHEIVYVARKGESPFGTVSVAGSTDHIMRLCGASDVAIEGISFKFNGVGCEGAADGAVVVERSSRIAFAKCKFAHIANYGLKVRNSSDVAVCHSLFNDNGSGAISAAGSGCVEFVDNVVVGSGASQTGLAAVSFGQGVRGKSAHNDFCRLECAALSVGKEVVTEKNRFWRVKGEKDSPRNDDTGVLPDDRQWRARVEMLTF